MSNIGQVRRSSIDVLIRVRPMRVELHEVKSAWDISATTLREKGNPDSLFTFDHVYNNNATTQELYERSVRNSIVENVAKGYNGTVFAYGQTGSGKSYTMLGGGISNNNSSDIQNNSSGGAPEGLVALSVRDLFADLEKEQQRNPSLQVSVYVTMIEIYNEQLRDLLTSPGLSTPPLSIRENEHGVYVHNAIKREVTNARECIQLIQTQASTRVSAATAMNEQSSRSHCVIRVLVEKTFPIEYGSDASSFSDDDDDDDLNNNNNNSGGGSRKKIVATLNLVDLAGSERVAKTGSTGVRMVEGGHINKSLTILTTVISRLTEGNNNNTGATTTFVPYRDSRLTHLLKTAIGGNSLTAVFCCITPAIQHVDESRSTLQFAARVKTIKNKVSLNEIADPKTKLRQMEVDLRRYRRMLLATTLYLWSKNIKIKQLQTKLDNFIPFGNSNSNDMGNHNRVSRTSPSEQQRLIIEKLTQQNETLQQELIEVKDLLQQSSNANQNIYTDPKSIYSNNNNGITIDLADDAEKQQLRADVRDLEQMLKEALDEKSAIQQSMDELDSFCKELEDENAAQLSSFKKLQITCKELQTLIDTKGDVESAAKNEVRLLKDQLSKIQSELISKGRGDEYLQELTKLHIEHQELQYSHHQLQEKYNREMNEERTKKEEMQARIEELEDEVAETRETNKLQNSYLWRLLSVASVLTRGKAIDPEETVSTVRGTQVDAAVKTLSTFVLASLEKPPGVLESTENVNQKEKQEQKQTETGVRGDGGDATLLKRIDELEQQLIARDAQRDVIVDSKLSRMQNLTMRLHTTNTALIEELRQAFALNEELFRFVDKHPKLAPKLAKSGLVPMSFKAAVERATLAKVPTKPHGHN